MLPPHVYAAELQNVDWHSLLHDDVPLMGNDQGVPVDDNSLPSLPAARTGAPMQMDVEHARTRVAEMERQVQDLKSRIGKFESDCGANSSRIVREAFLSSQRRFEAFANELHAEGKHHAKVASLKVGEHAELAVLSVRSRFLALYLDNAGKYEGILIELLSDASFKTVKQRRRILSREAKALLNHWLAEHLHHPFPTAEEKADLAQRAGITTEQVTVWFINARCRKTEALQVASASASADDESSSKENKRKRMRSAV